MIETKGFKQIKLEGKDAIETFCTSDGLSLQSLFFAVFNEFPSLYTFKSDEAHSSYFFDTMEILTGLKNMGKKIFNWCHILC